MTQGTGVRGPGSGKNHEATTTLRGRYARQLGIPGIGEAGQERLAAARVVVLGAGGLGFPVLTYLGAAGVGAIVVVDHDLVEASNLNRQCLFGEADIGQAKAARACAHLRALNSTVGWEAVNDTVTDENAGRLLAGADLAVDCADNWEARFALAASAWRAGVPVVHGAVAGFEGTVAVLGPPGPCVACLYPEVSGTRSAPPPVLGAVAGVVGSLMATEAIRALCGGRRPGRGRVLLLDLERGSFDWVAVRRVSGCRICAD